ETTNCCLPRCCLRWWYYICFFINDTNMMKQFSKLMVMVGVMWCCLLACQPGQQVAHDVGAGDGAAPAREPKRVGMVTGLSPEKAAHYKELHADTWEGVLAAIKQYNIRNYSIFVTEIDSKLY